MLYDAVLEAGLELFNLLDWLYSLSLSGDTGGSHRSWASAFSSDVERMILGGDGGCDNRRGFGGTKGAGVCTRCAILVGAGVENLGNAGMGGAADILV
jgi:hypothetical protein